MTIGNLHLKNNLILAPMAGVTDCVFRSLCVRFGAALTFTEMVSAKGLSYQSKHSKALLMPSDGSALTGAQLFGNDPDLLAQQANSGALAAFDIIDINMGCPARKISGNGEGSALMKDTVLAYRIMQAVVSATDKPVTVKMRAGWDNSSRNAPMLAELAEKAGIAAITIHGRTKEQGYSGKADYSIIAEVKRSVSIPVIGNGDVNSGADAKRLLAETGCDGIMIARGATGRPWIFAEILAVLSEMPVPALSWDEKMQIALEHGSKLAELKGEKIAMLQMRKHLSWYISGQRNAAHMRESINKLSTLAQLRELIEKMS